MPWRVTRLREGCGTSNLAAHPLSSGIQRLCPGGSPALVRAQRSQGGRLPALVRASRAQGGPSTAPVGAPSSQTSGSPPLGGPKRPCFWGLTRPGSGSAPIGVTGHPLDCSHFSITRGPSTALLGARRPHGGPSAALLEARRSHGGPSTALLGARRSQGGPSAALLEARRSHGGPSTALLGPRRRLRTHRILAQSALQPQPRPGSRASAPSLARRPDRDGPATLDCLQKVEARLPPGLLRHRSRTSDSLISTCCRDRLLRASLGWTAVGHHSDDQGRRWLGA